jgi:hypothetical protein
VANVLNGTTYIVIVEPGTSADIPLFVEKIKSYGTWAQLSEHAWAVVAMGQNASTIRDQLKPMVGTGGRLFIIKSGYESAWLNIIATREWLVKYLAN